MKSEGFEPAEELIEQIMHEYSKRPSGWHVLNTLDGDMIVIGPESAFQLRLIPLSPFQFTGVGTEIPRDLDAISSLGHRVTFGLRPLEEADLRAIVDAVDQQTRSPEVLSQVLQRRPIPLTDIRKHKHILSGPVLTRPDLTSSDSVLRRLRDDLDREARRLFSEKYPQRAGMFF